MTFSKAPLAEFYFSFFIDSNKHEITLYCVTTILGILSITESSSRGIHSGISNRQKRLSPTFLYPFSFSKPNSWPFSLCQDGWEP